MSLESVSRDVTELTGRKYDVVALLTNVAKSAVKEKVTRVVVATLRVSRHDK